jgi:hypothetical protein
MRRFGSGSLLGLVLVVASSGPALGQARFTVPRIGGAVVLADNITLVASLTADGKLGYFDTLADKELKRVEVDFKPTVLARQGDRIFAVAKGTAIVHVLSAATGKEVKEIKVPGEPIQALACNPGSGLLYSANLNNEVHAIDTDKGTVTATKAKGQLLVVDAAEGKYVYAGIQKPIQDRLVVERVGEKLVISTATANLRALMLKYEVTGSDLKLVAVNDNAAINGRGMGVSPDGKKVAMAGGGGWRSKTDPKANYAIAVFDTSDISTMLGQVETGAYPVQIAFHPVLNLGAAFRDGEGGLIIFNGKSFAKKESFKTTDKGYPDILLFAGQGTKVVYAATGQGTGAPANSVLEFFPLPLTDEEKDLLRKAIPK